MLYVAMKKDLKNLEITRSQRKKLIGDEGLFSRVESGGFTSFLEFFLRFMGLLLAPVGVLLLLLYFLGVEWRLDQESTILAGVLSFFASLILVLLSFLVPKGYRQAFEHLSKLFGEVEKHNKIVKDIHILDQLRKAGIPVGLSDREQVLEALRLTRGHLVRAFRTERILRENPGFRPERFPFDFQAHHALQVSEEASGYGRLLDVALEVGEELQEEMIKLLEDRTSE